MMNIRNLILSAGLAGLLGISALSCSPRQSQEQLLYYNTQHTPYATFNKLIKKLQDRDTSRVASLISKDLMDLIYMKMQQDPTILDNLTREAQEDRDRRAVELYNYCYDRQRYHSLFPRVLLDNFNLTRYDLSKVRILRMGRWVKERLGRSQAVVTILLGQLNDSTGLVEDVFGHSYSDDQVDIAMVQEDNKWKLIPIHDEENLGDYRQGNSGFAYSPSRNVMAFYSSTFGYDPQTDKERQISAGIYLAYSNGDGLVRLQDALTGELRQKDDFLVKLEGNPRFLSERKKGSKTFYTLKYTRIIGYQRRTNPKFPEMTSLVAIEKETTVEFPFPP